MELYFLRHGASVARSDWQEDDLTRPLTEEGRAKLAHASATMLRLGLQPDVIVTSPLKRAAETAEIVAAGLGSADRVKVDERVAEGFTAKRLRRVLQDHEGVQRIMLVGHEPDFSKVIRRLTGGRVRCTKGSLVRVDVADAGAEEGELVLLLQADVLSEDAVAVRADGSGRRRPEETPSGQPTATAPSGEQVPLLDRNEAPGEDSETGRHAA